MVPHVGPAGSPTLEEDRQATSRRRWFFYVFFPAGLSLTLVGMYFSGVGWLGDAVASAVSREYGLLESIQALTILVIFGLAVVALCRAASGRARVLALLLAAVSLVALLEELDYGMHLMELLRGLPPHQGAEARNLHNIGDNTSRLKALNHLVMGLFFVVLPLVAAWSSRPLLQRLAPHRLSIVTVILMVLVTQLAHLLDDSGAPHNGSLTKNISEFGELFVYYLWLVYFWELILNRRGRAPAGGAPGS